MQYPKKPWMTTAELVKFRTMDDNCPEVLRPHLMCFFLDLYDLLMKFGIEKAQDDGKSYLGITSRKFNLLIFTPVDPDDRTIVICDPPMSDVDNWVLELPDRGRVVWDTRYTVEQMVELMGEVDRLNKKFIDSKTGRREEHRIKQR